MTPPGLRDVLPSAAALLGVPGAPDRLGLREELGPVPRVAVVLVDGLGLHLLDALAERAPLLAAARAGARQLTCGFPSTTPVSLVTLGTGEPPGAHGVLGFTVGLPGPPPGVERQVLVHTHWRDDPPPHEWQPLPTWFAHVAAAGLRATAVLPSFFVGSGLTDAAYRGAALRSVGRDDDAAAALVDEVRRGPGLVYGYISSLDTAMHLHGVGSPAWLAAAAEVDAYLTRIVEGLPEDAVLLVTADHGGLNAGTRVDLAREPDLAVGVRTVAGEPRVRYLYTVPGATADVVAAWRAVLGTRADVLTRDEAIGRGWFGCVEGTNADRLGDVIAVCLDDTVVLATGGVASAEPPEMARLVGFHGALTPVETAIPLLLPGR
ncbi:alkaline phosphatase family protein [Jatrophihabitans fulvus]